jgi:antigen 43
VRDAFADNQPHRDLVVSPDHGILIDGQLVPAKLLINGTTITQDRSVKTVTYHHVELDRHAILLAEGLPAESYLDTGNRAFFANAGLALVLHPEFEVNANLKCWENDSCAPLAVTPDVVGPIWHRLSERAAALGYVAPNVARTGDANVHLLADGRELRPVNIDRDRFVFMLPAGVQDLRLVSRASAPRDVVAYHDDPRQLGVLVSRISIRAGDVVHDVPLDHPALSEGWHPVERANGRTWRWTSGAGALPISMSTNPLIIEMKLHQRDTYLLAGIDVPTRIAA